MAFEQLSYDPQTGIRRLFDFDEETGATILKSEQDMEPHIRWAAMNRAAGTTRDMLKKDDYFCLHSTIPALVEVELRNKGLRLDREEDLPRIAREIEQNYPYLKCTDLKLWRPT